MVDKSVRITLNLPKAMLDEINQFVGRENLDTFLAEAIKEKLKREQLGRALEATAGCLPPGSHPEWETPEMVSAWVRELRAVDQEIADRKLKRHTHR